jgi:SAM-dependent methyltransferase
VSGVRPDYTGVDILRALERANNYNTLLVDLILRTATSRCRTLDFGAGIGTFSKLLRTKGMDVTCVEPDFSLSEALTRDGFPTFRDLNELPDGCFEFIVAMNVLEHIEDDRATLCQLGAKLEKQGRLFVYVPAFECLRTSLDEKLGHYRRYRRPHLERLARSTGLSILESRYVDSLGFFAALSFKIFGNKGGDLSTRAITLYDSCVVPPSRALDPLLGRLFGKNVYVVAMKD